MTRRSFFVLLSKALFFFGLVPPFSLLRLFEGGSVYLAAHRLSRIFKNHASAKIIGGKYLSAYPQEADLRHLVASLSSSDVSGQNQKDFEEGRTVMVDGWILGLTEARLCGLTTFI